MHWLATNYVHPLTHHVQKNTVNKSQPGGHNKFLQRHLFTVVHMKHSQQQEFQNVSVTPMLQLLTVLPSCLPLRSSTWGTFFLVFFEASCLPPISVIKNTKGTTTLSLRLKLAAQVWNHWTLKVCPDLFGTVIGWAALRGRWTALPTPLQQISKVAIRICGVGTIHWCKDGLELECGVLGWGLSSGRLEVRKEGRYADPALGNSRHRRGSRPVTLVWGQHPEHLRGRLIMVCVQECVCMCWE